MISKLNSDHATTAQFGQTINTKPESIRRGFCTKGHYLGLKPIKLDNGRLLWPVDGIKRILSGDQNGDEKESDDQEYEEDDKDEPQVTTKNKSGPVSPT